MTIDEAVKYVDEMVSEVDEGNPADCMRTLRMELEREQDNSEEWMRTAHILLQRAERAEADRNQWLADYGQLAAKTDRYRKALEGLLDHFYRMQVDAESYLIPDNSCNQEWFINGLLYHLDGPVQREVQQAACEALKEKT